MGRGPVVQRRLSLFVLQHGGGDQHYKYGAEWQPIDDFRLRASYERAVRAPNVLELFAPTNVVLFSGQDPCFNATGVVFNNCVHNKYAPVPAGAITSGLVYCPATQCDVQLGGNPLLKPEVSDTRTAGIVFTPTFVDGFTATVDWFNIKVDNYISTLPPQEILNDCYGATASAASMAYFCPLVHRNGAGLVYGTGFVSAQNINTGFLQTKGADFELNYQTDMSTWGMENTGSLTFNFIGTYLTELDTEPVPQSPLLRGVELPFNCAGLYGLTCSATSDENSQSEMAVQAARHLGIAMGRGFLLPVALHRRDLSRRRHHQSPGRRQPGEHLCLQQRPDHPWRGRLSGTPGSLRTTTSTWRRTGRCARVWICAPASTTCSTSSRPSSAPRRSRCRPATATPSRACTTPLVVRSSSRQPSSIELNRLAFQSGPFRGRFFFPRCPISAHGPLRPQAWARFPLTRVSQAGDGALRAVSAGQFELAPGFAGCV